MSGCDREQSKVNSLELQADEERRRARLARRRLRKAKGAAAALAALLALSGCAAPFGGASEELRRELACAGWAPIDGEPEDADAISETLLRDLAAHHANGEALGCW